MFDVASHYQATGYGEASKDVVDAILQEGAKFCEEMIAPINASGDKEGAKWVDGQVTTPAGFDKAMQAYREGDWGAVSSDPEYGGQGLPQSLELVFNEMAVASNVSWRMCTGLTLGAIHALQDHGSDELKRAYLPKLISAEWTARCA